MHDTQLVPEVAKLYSQDRPAFEVRLCARVAPRVCSRRLVLATLLPLNKSVIYVLATPLSLNKGVINARMWALHAIANNVAHTNVGVAGKGARVGHGVPYLCAYVSLIRAVTYVCLTTGQGARMGQGVRRERLTRVSSRRVAAGFIYGFV